jgi:hypothetical protein
MMKLYIPELGDQLLLTNDWHFDLYYERRNDCLYDVEEVEKRQDRKDYIIAYNTLAKQYNKAWQAGDNDLREQLGLQIRAIRNFHFPYLMPAGTILSVDRIYIRKGNEDYSSLSFNIIKTTIKRIMNKKEGGTFKGRRRFWAKLADCNNIEFERIEN